MTLTQLLYSPYLSVHPHGTTAALKMMAICYSETPGTALHMFVLLCYSTTLVNSRAMAQSVNRRPFTAEAGVRSQASPCDICGVQSGTVTGFSPRTSVPLSVRFTNIT